jgi:deoxyadenosine/deoxycytidine kinase
VAKIVSFEGPIGAGKTTLVNYVSNELGLDKITENIYQNPFIDEFYAGSDVKLETEIAFLLQHYSLLKNARAKHGLILADFSIEKDLVFARLNLDQKEFDVFNCVFDFAVETVGTQELVIYLDLSDELLIDRIRKRGHAREVDADPVYFRNYSDRLRSYFMEESKTEVLIIGEKDLKLVPDNLQLTQIKKAIQAIK